MRKNLFLAVICAFLISCAVIGVASAELSQSSSLITGKVYVTSVVFDPAEFFTGDVGTATYTVNNGNANQSVMLTHATYNDASVMHYGGTYDYSQPLGPLQSKDFTFSVIARGSEGVYFPEFTASMYDSNLYYKTRVRIDNSPLELTVVDKPDAFSQGKKKTIYLQAANPRGNEVSNLMLDASGDGISATPSRIFVGNLAAGAKVPVNISITPERPTTLHLTLNYENGDNPHQVTMDLPVTFGVDKKQANPVMSNVQVTNTGGTYHITGDVNNAGLETANTVMVTALSPAVPQDPYKTYVVGALKPDDFGSFEVTFSASNATSIPVQLSFKDADGNVYDTVQDVKIPMSGASSQKGDSGLPIVPITAGIVILLVFVGGWVYHLKRNKK